MKTTAEILEKVDLWGASKNRPIWIPEDYEPKVIQDDPNWVLPTIQQVRSETTSLIDIILQNSMLDTALEIGLGRFGGTAKIWHEIFNKTITIEYSQERINNFISREGLLPDKRHTIIRGSSQSPRTLEFVKETVSELDFLWIDGSHSYNAVRGDYENYIDLVRPGGIIGFHDVLEDPRQPMYEVYAFLKELSEGFIDGVKHDVKYIINSRIGTAYEVKT